MLAALAHPLAPHLTASHPVSDNEVSNYAVAGPLKRVLAAPLVEESGVGRWRHHTRRDLRAPYGSYNQTVVAVPDECHRESWDHNCQQNRLDRDEPGNEISCFALYARARALCLHDAPRQQRTHLRNHRVEAKLRPRGHFRWKNRRIVGTDQRRRVTNADLGIGSDIDDSVRG